jgi:hypothetical protein
MLLPLVLENLPEWGSLKFSPENGVEVFLVAFKFFGDISTLFSWHRLRTAQKTHRKCHVSCHVKKNIKT